MPNKALRLTALSVPLVKLKNFLLTCRWCRAARELRRSVLALLNPFYSKLLAIMSTTKQEVESLLSKLPDDCSLEDIQYHLYVIEKMRNGLEAADSQGTVSQEEVEGRFGKWLTE